MFHSVVDDVLVSVFVLVELNVAVIVSDVVVERTLVELSVIV